MRTIIITLLSLIVAGCSASTEKLSEEAIARAKLPAWAAAGYPAGYENWGKFNDTPIDRAGDNEMVELYYNRIAAKAGALGYPVGSVLVKAQHRRVKGKKGQLFQLAVMHKKGGTQQAGWTFRLYDPKRYMQLSFDQDVCLVCHRQRARQDFTFSRFPTHK